MFIIESNIVQNGGESMDYKEEQQFNEIYEEEMNEINAQLDKEIVFALIGDVNAGKSSTVNQLLGEIVAPVGAQPGETVKVKKYKYKDKIVFVDTPGLDDIETNHSEQTLSFYKEADIVLFFLNAAGTVFSEGEKKLFDIITKVNKKVLIVLNKIDAADDIPLLLKYVQDHTNYQYKVIPISSRTNENMDMLRNAILDILHEEKKDILFAKHLKEKGKTANKWIIAAASSASAVGALPLPGSDIVPITSIQVGLMVRLATLYDKPITKKRAKEMAIASVTGNIGQSLFRQVVKLFPGAGSVVGASVAGSVTLALGYGIKYAYEQDIELDVKSLSLILEKLKQKKVPQA